MHLISMFFLCLLFVLVSGNNCPHVNKLHHSEGHLRIAFFLDCRNNTKVEKTRINSAIWTIDRINSLDFTPYKLGLSVYKTCEEKDLYKAIFELFSQDDSLLVGVVSVDEVPLKIKKVFADLGVRYLKKYSIDTEMFEGAVSFLKLANWRQDISVIGFDEDVVDGFGRLSRDEGVCIKENVIMGSEHILKPISNNVVILGSTEDVSYSFEAISNTNILYVSLDGYPAKELPEDTFVLQPKYLEPSNQYELGSQIVPTPTFFEIATPLLRLTQNLTEMFTRFCHNETDKFQCLRDSISESIINSISESNKHLISESNRNPKFYSNGNPISYSISNSFLNSPNPIPNFVQLPSFLETLAALKIETLLHEFNFNILKVENISLLNQNETIEKTPIQNLVKIGVYNIFTRYLELTENISQNNTKNSTQNINQNPYQNLNQNPYQNPNQNPNQNPYQNSNQNLTQDTIENNPQICPECFTQCINYDFKLINTITLRQESWIFAYLAVSALGIIFSLAILIFFLIRLSKKDIFEGNPTMSILLLLIVILMYGSVAPFALSTSPTIQNLLCQIKYTSISLVYAAAFSLLLSRSIILATISKELGFMAHVSGPVQVFLCFFMFTVQLVLSIQFIGSCLDMCHFKKFLITIPYNVVLLFLLMCTSLFVMRSERNYKEGKYFTIAIFVMVMLWSFWVPIYFLYLNYTDHIICFGLVSTASTLLGCIFIPRTYVMTVSVARDRFTSALPALASANSMMDIYKANTQPIYDCINIATVRAAVPLPRRESFENPAQYSSATLPEVFQMPKCETPIGSDKLTRF